MVFWHRQPRANTFLRRQRARERLRSSGAFKNEFADRKNVVVEIRVRRLDLIELFVGDLGITRVVAHFLRRGR